MSAKDEDIRQIRAEQWRKAKQQQKTPSKSSSKGSNASATPNLFGHALRFKAAIVVCLAATLTAPAVLKQLQHRQLLAGLNASEQPDATLRPGHTHRDFVLSLGHDFVEIYSKKAPKIRETSLKDGHREQAWGADFNTRKAAITRCITTQYAATTYFCGKQAADAGIYRSQYSMNSTLLLQFYKQFHTSLQNEPNTNSAEAQQAAPQCPTWPEFVFRCHINDHTDAGVGHTFIFHFLPEGGVQIYQSFITHYTLIDYLQDHGPMDYKQFVQFVERIQLLEQATSWHEAEDEAYLANFMVSLGKSNNKLGRLGGMLSSGQQIKFTTEIVCMAAPWLHGDMGRLLEPLASSAAAVESDEQ